MREPYDSFDYLKPADYLPALKEGYQQINQGFEDAEAFARVNDRQRLANAEIMGRAIDNAAKFSKSMAGHLKKKKQEKEDQFAREAFNLSMKVPLSYKGFLSYKNDENGLHEDHLFHQYAAKQAYDSGDIKLANTFQNLSGWQNVVLKKVVGRTWAANYENDFYGENGINAKNNKGQYIYQLELPNDNGSTRILNWGNAQDNDDRALLIDDYNNKQGLEVVKDFRPEFAKDNFWKSYETAVNNILTRGNQQDKADFDLSRFDQYDQRLIAAAQTNNFAEEFHQIINEASVWKGANQTDGDIRKMLKERVMNMILSGKIKPGEASLAGYTFDHRGTNEKKGLDFFTELSTWDQDITLIQDKINKLNTAKETADMNEYVENLYASAESTGEMLSEKDVPAIYADFRKRFPNVPFEKWPADLKDIATKEDIADADLIATLQYKKDNFIPIGRADWMYIYNADERKKWREYAATASGKGMEEEFSTHRNDWVPTLVGDFLKEFTGTTKEESKEFKILKEKAIATYNTAYSTAINNWDPNDMKGLKESILTTVEKAIPTFSVVLSAPTDTTKFAEQVKAAKNFIADTERDPNLNHIDRLSNTLLPQSEGHMENLIKFANDPLRNPLPHYYYKVAAPLKGLTPWHVAAMQYKLYTGKELPKPNSIAQFEELSAGARQMLTTYPTSKTPVQVNILEGKDDPNRVEYLTPGLIGATA